MGYKRAEDILPKEIIELIQQYIDGENIYIPRKSERRLEWGTKTATKRELAVRNKQIYNEYLTGMKVEELANTLQVCLDSGAKKVLLPIASAVDLGSVPAELIGCFNLIFYNSVEDAVFKALGVE